jgi:hypothetical protein
MTIPRTRLCAGGLVLLSAVAGAETIYRCESAGGLVFSDRPCAVDAEVHAPDGSRVTVYHAPPISKRASEPRSKALASKHSARKNASAYAKHQQACAKLDQSLREVRTTLRTGYGVKEGERLKAKQRDLAERRRMQRCR